MRFLLDTDVVSEIRKPRASRQVSEWFSRTPSDSVHLSVITIGELRRGVVRVRDRGDHKQAAVLERWTTSVMDAFEGRILPVSSEVAELWGEQSARHAPPVADGLIAATALTHGLTMVTRNVRDFRATGVRMINPFDG